ncbi:MAG TPA: hypothetical protein VG816_00885, partial [Solirubrobacterales bacterium]|nr:hypothetical protein [Solirubrobacterales bacterium]
MTPWKLPFVVAGVVVPVAAAFMLGGPGVGVAVGALAAVALVAIAARRPDEPIAPPRERDGARHVLIVAAEDVEDPADVARVTRAAGIGGEDGGGDEVRVLVPARIGFLDRWASDVEDARHRAQQRLVVTVAALARAGVAAEARVGDEDIVQAVEDQLQSYPATEVVLVGTDEDGEGEAAEQLRARLRAGFRYVRLG